MSHISRNLGPEGALIDIAVSVFPARLAMLTKLGLAVPAPVYIKAQVDTGAYCSGIHLQVFEAQELHGEIDTQPIFTPSTAEDPHPAPVYVANITLIGAQGDRIFEGHLVLAHIFTPSEEARALIGRDILDLCHLEYDGPRKKFTLVF